MCPSVRPSTCTVEVGGGGDAHAHVWLDTLQKGGKQERTAVPVQDGHFELPYVALLCLMSPWSMRSSNKYRNIEKIVKISRKFKKIL